MQNFEIEERLDFIQQQISYIFSLCISPDKFFSIDIYTNPQHLHADIKNAMRIGYYTARAE